MSKVNLDSPAFGEGAATINPDQKENDTAQASQAESGDEKSAEAAIIKPASGGEKPDVTSDDEGQKVPYSRLQSVIEARREAERKAEEAEQRYQELLASRNSDTNRNQGDGQTYAGSLPEWWVKLYGDSEESKQAYGYELERQRQIREEARQEAIEAVRQERAQEGQVLAENERTIDNKLEDLALTLGRDLTDKEETAVLDIVDEYTPKDENGNYAGDLIPFDKAYEIYELRQSKATGKVNKARQTPTALTSARSESESVTTKEKDDSDWNPLDWNSWRKRVPNA